MQRETIVKYIKHKFEFVHEQELGVIFDNFCDWSEDYGFEQFHQEEFNQILLEEKNKDWCKSLYKAQKDEIRTMEERNAKIRKIEKKSQTVEFFTDDSVFIHILQFLRLKELFILRRTCTFVKLFLAKYQTLILKYLKFTIGFRPLPDSTFPDVGIYELLSTAKDLRKFCLISGIEAPLVEKLVIASTALKSKRKKEFVTTQFLELFNSTVKYFDNKCLLEINWEQNNLKESQSKLQLQNMSFPICMRFSKNGFPIQSLSLSQSPLQIWIVFPSLHYDWSTSDFVHFAFNCKFKHPVYIIITGIAFNYYFDWLATKEHVRLFVFYENEARIQKQRIQLREPAYAPPDILFPEACDYFIQLLQPIKKEVNETTQGLIEELANAAKTINGFFGWTPAL